jgi:hypothetical protein
VGGTRFFCDVYQKVGFEQDFMDLNITIECYLDTTTGFDFRRASGCTCTTLLTPSNASRLPKTCPCYVCPIGFGSSSVSIDCSYLIPNATDATNATNATATASTVPSSVPSFSPAAATSAPAAAAAAVPTASSGSPTSAAPVVGGGQAIPIAPTLNPAGSGAPVTAAAGSPTGAPSSAGSGAVPQMQRRHLQGGSTDAPSPAASLVNGTANTTNTTTANVTVLPDPYIFDTCVSVDCGGNCNGTCSLGCDDPTASTLCDFCEGAAGSPTPVPTGSDGSGSGTSGSGGTDVPTIGSKSGAVALTVGGIRTLVILGWVAAGAAAIMTEGGM